MKKLMLIGGGEVGRGQTMYETKEIDEEIVKMTEKENPTFLFIGLASSFSDSYYDTMKKIYKELGCTCTYLKKKNILNNPDIVKNKISSADIIYICGGDTVKLLEDVKKYGIDSLLKEALEQGTVFAGISAGAILMCQGGYSDALILRGESDDYSYLEGLGFINISICPHYKSSTEKDISLKNYLKEKESSKMYCLENCTALKIIDNFYEVIKSDPSKDAYLCINKDKIVEEKITSGLIN